MATFSANYQKLTADIQSEITDLKKKVVSAEEETLHPMALYELPSGVTNNISIDLKFMTNDDSSPGRICYVLTRKVGREAVNDKNFIFQGYGLAFRTGSNPADHNLFITDNGVVSREVIVSHQAILDRGLYSYLTSSYCQILPNIYYRLKMIINKRNGITVWIWPDGEDQPSSPSIIFGAQSDEPADSTSAELLWYTPICDIDYVGNRFFGLAVDGCNNNLWHFDELAINYLDNEFVHQGFSFAGENLPDEYDLWVSAYGKGADGEEKEGLLIYFLNAKTEEWDLQTPDVEVGTGIYTLYKFSDIDKDTYVDPLTHRFIVQLTTTYPGDPELVPPVYSEIGVNYIILAGQLSPGHSIGGKTDIFLRGGLSETSTSLTIPDTGIIPINKEDFSLPISQISRVVLTDSPGGNEILDIDFAYEILDWRRRYSTKNIWERIKVGSENGALSCNIYYSYFTQIQDLQNHIDSTKLRSPCHDFAVYQYIPIYCDTSLEYSGTMEESDVVSLVKNYINSDLKDTIEYLKFISLFTDNSLSPNLDSFDIDCELISRKGISTEYSLKDSKYIKLEKDVRPIARNIQVTKI